MADVGIIGLGIMGAAFAHNLQAAGLKVSGFDVDARRRNELRAAGVEIAEDTGGVAETAEIIISSLPGDEALHAAIEAITGTGLRNRTIIETSTLALDAKSAARDRLANAGNILLDCPVSGTGAQARNRDLTIYASGDTAAIKRCEKIFSGIAKMFFDLGEFGNGSKMKYVANLLVAIHNVAAAEALVLAMKAGLDPGKVIDVIRHGAGNSRMLEVRGPLMANASYQQITASFPLFLKDIGIISDFASNLNCPTPLMNASLPYYAAGNAMFPTCDVSAIVGILETMAGHKRS